jgi:hypothetical protein
MLHGMIVTREGQPMQVRSIQGPAVGVVPGPDPQAYTLQDWGGTELARLVDPLATDIPLLPRCPECGQGAFPGDYGSPGWQCRDTCLTGVLARAALVTAP